MNPIELSDMQERCWLYKVEISAKELLLWFQGALRTERRLPSGFPKQKLTAQWEIKQDDWYGYGWNKVSMRIPPSPRSISQMMFCYELLWTLKKEEDRRLLLCRAGNVPWKQICHRLGKHRSTLDRQLSVILLRLIDKIRKNKKYGQTLQKILSHRVS